MNLLAKPHVSNLLVPVSKNCERNSRHNGNISTMSRITSTKWKSWQRPRSRDKCPTDCRPVASKNPTAFSQLASLDLAGVDVLSKAFGTLRYKSHCRSMGCNFGIRSRDGVVPVIVQKIRRRNNMIDQTYKMNACDRSDLTQCDFGDSWSMLPAC